MNRRSKVVSNNSSNSDHPNQYHQTTNPSTALFSQSDQTVPERFNMSTMMTSCRDRTGEFQSAIRSFQSRVSNPIQPVPNPNGSNAASKQANKLAINQRHQFMLMAKKIGKELTNTCIKLEKLTDLAKKQSLFDDRPKEIQELTYLIKQDLGSLHTEISKLQEFVKINQNHDGKNMQKHSCNVVYTLQSKLANVSKDFKNVLEVRSENLKHQNERGEKYFSKTSLNPTQAATMFAPPKLPGSTMGKSVLLLDETSQSTQQRQTNGGLNNRSNYYNSQQQQDDSAVINMDLMQKQHMQKSLIVNQEESFLRERATAMQTVEQTIVELGGMFQQLATMIKEQDEAIQRIDSNIEDVDLNISEAHSELLKYFQSVTSNRWLMIKIFFVLIVFFVVFIVVMT